MGISARSSVKQLHFRRSPGRTSAWGPIEHVPEGADLRAKSSLSRHRLPRICRQSLPAPAPSSAVHCRQVSHAMPLALQPLLRRAAKTTARGLNAVPFIAPSRRTTPVPRCRDNGRRTILAHRPRGCAERRSCAGMPCAGRSRVFHKILKSGCRAEQSRSRTAERVVNLMAVFCIFGWRVFWLTMLNRTAPDLQPTLVLTEIEIKLLDRLIPEPEPGPSTPKTLSSFLTSIARLGGYLAHARNPPPGNTVIWRGLSRLNDIALGATLQADNVGNRKLAEAACLSYWRLGRIRALGWARSAISRPG